MSPQRPKRPEAPSEPETAQNPPATGEEEQTTTASPPPSADVAVKPDADDKPAAPPLPSEPAPEQDDGWECQWDQNTHAWFFYNRITGKRQWDNPRVPEADDGPRPPVDEDPDSVGGYNPAVHGDYDPNAWYAQRYKQDEAQPAAGSRSGAHGTVVAFNRLTGDFEIDDLGAGRHTDEAKSRRQMSAFFDVDAAAQADDGRSLRAERANKRISKSELKAFKEKRKAKKEERRRAWLRD